MEKEMKKLILTALLLCLTCACAQVNGTESGKVKLSNKAKAKALVESIETGNPEPIGYINPNRYIQHNLAVGDGWAGFGEVMAQLPKGSARAKVVRAFQDGDYGFTHTEYNFFGHKIGFDIFRFENGQIVEHWDNLQEIATTSASGRTQTDGPTEVTDLDQTETNKKLVAGVLADVFMGANPGKITEYISTSEYLQHNPAVADGLGPLGEALAAMAKAGTPMVYTKNHMILGEGNFVLAVSEGQFLGKHSSFYDLFRIESGKIVEHWDTIQQIPAESEWRNSNGKF
jgi:predicted SnoaL-like aldol condensation-catalyzing enzyme